MTQFGSKILESFGKDESVSDPGGCSTLQPPLVYLPMIMVYTG